MYHWPLTELRASTPMVELRWPSLDDLDELATRGAEGVHDPAVMPFFSRWTDGEPDVVARRVLQRHLAAWGSWNVSDWTLYLVVVYENMVVGSQSVGAVDFAQSREVVLTSWLGRRFQGMGIGGQARAALLNLIFEGLGADRALTVVMRDNVQSRGVCHKFGFTHDGVQHNVVRGKRVVSDRWRLSAKDFDPQGISVEYSGLSRALPEFGLDTPAASSTPVPIGPVTDTDRPRASRLSGVQMVMDGDMSTNDA